MRILSSILICIIILLNFVNSLNNKILVDSRFYNDFSANKLLWNNSGTAENQNPFWNWLVGIIGGKPTTTTEKPTQEHPIPIKDCGNCNCGITNKSNRIVGGHETQVNEYPWMTMLLYSGKFYCGGSLINDRYILTAAHCTQGFNYKYITIRLLEHNRVNSSNPNRIDRKIKKVIRHARYDSSSYNNDIALLQLDEPVEFKGLLRPVCLPVPFKSFSNETGIVTGWGATREHGSPSDFLQEVQVRIMPNSECRKTNYGSSRITDNMMCAGEREGGKDSCQGDSGGPLHVIEGTTYMISGIVSWGVGCAQPNYPGVYTRVNRFRTWILSNTVDSCYCK